MKNKGGCSLTPCCGFSLMKEQLGTVSWQQHQLEAGTHESGRYALHSRSQ